MCENEERWKDVIVNYRELVPHLAEFGRTLECMRETKQGRMTLHTLKRHCAEAMIPASLVDMSLEANKFSKMMDNLSD